MGIRRDYTNQFGYFCPTENAAIYEADKPIQKPRQIKPRPSVGVLREDEIARMDKEKKDTKSSLIDYFNQVEKVEVPEKPDQGLKIARSLKVIFNAIAALQKYKIKDCVLVDKATQKEYKWGDL